MPHVFPTGLPAFEDVMILTVVTLLHVCVSVGDAVVAPFKPLLLPLGAGFCTIARNIQVTATTDGELEFVTTTNDAWTTEAAAKTSVLERLERELRPRKASPPTVLAGTHKCTLLWSSFAMGATQRSRTDRARRFLEDQLVVFDEVDAETCALDVRNRLFAASGERMGVFPQVFVEPIKQATDGTTTTRYISFAQLETAEFYAHTPLAALKREGAVEKSALYLFKDVATLAVFEDTYYGQRGI